MATPKKEKVRRKLGGKYESKKDKRRSATSAKHKFWRIHLAPMGGEKSEMSIATEIRGNPGYLLASWMESECVTARLNGKFDGRNSTIYTGFYTVFYGPSFSAHFSP